MKRARGLATPMKGSSSRPAEDEFWTESRGLVFINLFSSGLSFDLLFTYWSSCLSVDFSFLFSFQFPFLSFGSLLTGTQDGNLLNGQQETIYENQFVTSCAISSNSFTCSCLFGNENHKWKEDFKITGWFQRLIFCVLLFQHHSVDQETTRNPLSR